MGQSGNEYSAHESEHTQSPHQRRLCAGAATPLKTTPPHHGSFAVYGRVSFSSRTAVRIAPCQSSFFVKFVPWTPRQGHASVGRPNIACITPPQAPKKAHTSAQAAHRSRTISPRGAPLTSPRRGQERLVVRATRLLSRHTHPVHGCQETHPRA